MRTKKDYSIKITIKYDTARYVNCQHTKLACYLVEVWLTAWKAAWSFHRSSLYYVSLIAPAQIDGESCLWVSLN
jgi:hypothetical protein